MQSVLRHEFRFLEFGRILTYTYAHYFQYRKPFSSNEIRSTQKNEESGGCFHVYFDDVFFVFKMYALVLVVGFCTVEFLLIYSCKVYMCV